MNTTIANNNIATSQPVSASTSSIASEVLFFVKTSVVMTAMVLLLASAWV